MFRILLSISFVILFLGPASAQGDQRFSASVRAHAVEELALVINDTYFDEHRAAEIAELLRGRLSDGGFNDAATPDQLAEQVTALLSEHDRHFAVRFVGREAVQAAMAGDDHSGEDQPHGDPRTSNFGFRNVSVLSGNVGYIDLRMFAPISIAGTTATAALDFVANTDAVIFDVRNNGGGEPSMVQFLISHFLNPSEPVTINTFVSRNSDFAGELNSLQYLPSQARPEVPLYVLTSARTGSAAEAFAYHLQAMERATIVGETTYGAGNPGDFFTTEEGYSIFISTGSARNPITLTNWEGVGVAPDVDVEADAALDQALLLAYGKIINSSDGASRQRNLSWAQEDIQHRLSPVALSTQDLEEFVGTYGPRRVFMEGDTLTYQRGEQNPVSLAPLGDDRFLFGTSEEYRLLFQRNQRGEVTSLTILLLDGNTSVSQRD